MDTLRGMEPGQLSAQVQALALSVHEGEPGQRSALADFLGRHNPIDVARILADLEPEDITLTFDLLETEARSVVLSETGAKEQALLLMHVGDQGAALIAALEPDDAADVLEAVEEPEREALLRDIGPEDAQEIRELREYEPDTAGGLMTPETVAVAPDATQAGILEAIRSDGDAETINVIYVTDEDVLLGVVSIRDVIVAAPSAPVGDYMTKEVIQVGANEDQEEVIRIMKTYHLGAVPVVDRTGCLLGMITADDALSALEVEASEDVMALAGAGSATPTEQTVWERVWARAPWLMLTLFGGIAAGWIIRSLAVFYGAERAVEATAQHLPHVAGLAGNVGMQSSAVMLRGFATGEIHRSRVRRVVREEILVALVNGVLCGAISGIMALLIAPDLTFPTSRFFAVALAVALASTSAGTMGAILPSICNRFGIDPAISAGPFITTLNDILGFTIYMTVCLGVFGLES